MSRAGVRHPYVQREDDGTENEDRKAHVFVFLRLSQ